VHQGAALYDGVEPVDGVGSIQYGTHCAVGLHQAVATLDDVSAAALLLALSVVRQSALDVISVAALGVGVVVSVDGHGGGYLGDGGGSISEERGAMAPATEAPGAKTARAPMISALAIITIAAKTKNCGKKGPYFLCVWCSALLCLHIVSCRLSYTH